MTPVLAIEHLLRELAPEVLAVIARRFRDFAAAEDAVQEALLAASTQWTREGLPTEPRGWLIHVAARRMTDHVRAEVARRKRETFVVSLIPPEDQLALAPDEENLALRDDTLSLLFMCCHPALTPSSAVALTLRAVGGLTTAEIAGAFLVPEATMAQRISRAKQSIKSSGVPFRAPSPEEIASRTASVMHVLYLLFNEGYTSSSGAQLVRTDLSDEAIRLTRLLRESLPSDPEITGLLALMLLTDARRAARSGPNGELIPLDAQDRSQWNRAAITEGIALIESAMPHGRVGAYQLQAAIAALHDEAPSTEQTDWAQIAALYGLLERMSDNPMVKLNRAVALAMVHGPQEGLSRLHSLDGDPRLTATHRLDAVRAHLFERAGDREAAVAHFERAAARATSGPERDYLMTQAARVRES